MLLYAGKGNKHVFSLENTKSYNFEFDSTMQHKEFTLKFMLKVLLNYIPSGHHFCAYSIKGYRTIIQSKTIVVKAV